MPFYYVLYLSEAPSIRLPGVTLSATPTLDSPFHWAQSCQIVPHRPTAHDNQQWPIMSPTNVAVWVSVSAFTVFSKFAVVQWRRRLDRYYTNKD